MKVELPTPVSTEEMKIDVREIEGILQGAPMNLPAWPEAQITLKDGRIVYIRAIQDSDIDPMLGYLEKVMKVEKDFYDIVGVRVYGEVLALRRKRLKDPFTLVGLVDGEWLGFANGRVWDKDVAVSLHTLTFSRRARLGWPMYYAKTYYAMELLKVTGMVVHLRKLQRLAHGRSLNGTAHQTLAAIPARTGRRQDLLPQPGYVAGSRQELHQGSHRSGHELQCTDEVQKSQRELPRSRNP